MSEENVITGTIKTILPAEEISDGKYRKQTVVVSNNSGYEGKEAIFAFELFEKSDAEKSKIDALAKFNKVGDLVDVKYEIRTNEFKGKYYTSLSAWSIFKAEGNEPTEGTDPDPATEEDCPF